MKGLENLFLNQLEIKTKNSNKNFRLYQKINSILNNYLIF